MNKVKKEQIRKHKEAREGLTQAEIFELDKKEAAEAIIMARASEIYGELFEEEFYFMAADAFGPPRPSDADILRKNIYRTEHGLPLLNEIGLTTERTGALLEHCVELAKIEASQK